MSDTKKTINPYGIMQHVSIPEAIMERTELTPADKLIYGKLAKCAGRDGRCYPKQTSIAKSTGLSRRAVQRSLKALEELELIGRVKGNRLIHQSDSYVFYDHEFLVIEADDSSAPPKATKRRLGKLQNDASIKEEIVEEEINTLPPVPPVQSDDTRAGGSNATHTESKSLPTTRTKKDDEEVGILTRLAKDPNNVLGLDQDGEFAGECPWAPETAMQAYQINKAILGKRAKKSYTPMEMQLIDRKLGKIPAETLLGLFIVQHAVVRDILDDNGDVIQSRRKTAFEDLYAFAQNWEWISKDTTDYMKRNDFEAEWLWPHAIHDNGLLHDIQGVKNPTKW